MLDRIDAFSKKHGLFPQEGLVLAAVSGGADSVCLLAALLELSQNHCFSVAVLHYNHQLRGAESDRDAEFVQQLCLEKNVSFHLGSGNVDIYAAENGFGLEEAARRLRYDFFYETADKLNAKRIATAHTADDNIETVLLNMTRGTGLNGLGGIPPMRGLVIRPMLEISRTDVLEFLRSRSLSYMEDSTNALPICSRNIVRHKVVPVLKELNPRLTESIASTVSLLREDEDYLDSLAAHHIDMHLMNDALDIPSLVDLPKPVTRRVIRRLAGRAATAKHVSAVLALCASESVSGSVSLPGCTIFREYDKLVVSAEKPLEGFTPVELVIGGRVNIPELGLTVFCQKSEYPAENERQGVNNHKKIHKSFNTFLFKFDSIYGNITIRSRETGDKIDLSGRNGKKTLKKLFIEKRIPVRKRALIPVLADTNGVLGIFGLGFDKRTACQPGDAVLEIIFEETAYET